MPVSDYVIQRIPQDVSDVVPCVTDAIRIFSNLQVSADEVEQLKLITANLAGLAISYGAGMVFDDTRIIGESGEGYDLEDAKWEIINHAVEIESQLKAVTGQPVGVNPMLVIAIAQLAINIAKWLKQRKNR
jgi:hypothetical protein